MSKNQSKNVGITLSLSPELYRRIKREADIKKISIEQLIIKVIEHGLRCDLEADQKEAVHV